MDFHLERTLRLKSEDEIKHKGLYSRAIVEVDDRGADVGDDMIPWVWTTSFRATELTVVDGYSYETMLMQGRPHEQPQISRRNYIQARLTPGRFFKRDILDREPTYRFFGTDRVIQDFRLDIHPTDDPAQEGCTSWGSVSYDSEVDFRTHITEDIVQFYLYVSTSLFERYLWNIGQGLANRVGLSVGFVDGFYSEWSPGVSTQDIKVLAGNEHTIEGAEGVDLPRLRKVGKAEFFMNGHFQLSPPGSLQEDQGSEEETAAKQGFRWPGRR